MIYHYPIYIRLWHILNALFFLVLILTGLSMQYSNPDSPVISFPVAVKLHNICGIGVTVNYLLFFIGNILSGNGKNYRIKFKGLSKKILLQLRYYLKDYFLNRKPPFPVNDTRKFNPLQGLFYSMAMYIGVPLLFITGWSLLFPELIPVRFMAVSGLLVTDLLHVITGFLMSVFMVVHIYLCSVGKKPLSNYRAILTGWQEVEKQ